MLVILNSLEYFIDIKIKDVYCISKLNYEANGNMIGQRGVTCLPLSSNRSFIDLQENNVEIKIQRFNTKSRLGIKFGVKSGEKIMRNFGIIFDWTNRYWCDQSDPELNLI